MADVTNYTIENASGANVRIDLNNVFAAIQSSNSKSTDLVTSQCVAGMPFLNTTSNILKIRNSSNGGFTEIGNIDTANLGLLLKSGGTMTGALLGHDGSNAAAPAFSFDTDTDLGLFRKSSNIMGFASSGTEQMIFDANGITLQSRNELRFADGDSSHYVAFEAPATVSSNVSFVLPSADGSSGQFIKTDGSGNLSFASVVNTITIGSNSISPGTTATSIAGLTSLTSTTLVGTNVKATNVQDASGNNASTPVQIQQGRAKAWVNFNGQGTVAIRDDFNVSSITDHGTGDYTVNLESGAVANSNYAVALSMKSTTNNQLSTAARPMIRSISGGYDTSGFRVANSNVSVQAGSDPIIFNAIVFGD